MIIAVSLFWMIAGTGVTCTVFVTLAVYIAYSLKKEQLNRERTMHIEREKKALEERLALASRLVQVGSLAGGMSFFLNRIFITVHGLMDLLKIEVGNKEYVTKLMRSITDEIKPGLKLTNQLQHLALPEQMTLRPLPMVEFVNAIKSGINPNIECILNIENTYKQDHNQLLLDPKVMHQLLNNLVINATDAMGKSGKLTFSFSHVNQDCLPDGMHPTKKQIYLRLDITDTGHGIKEDDLNHLFEPFFSTRDSGARLGLGLSFVYGIVKYMEGHISFASVQGAGTTASLFLPVPTPTELNIALENTPPDEMDLEFVMTPEDSIGRLRNSVIGQA